MSKDQLELVTNLYMVLTSCVLGESISYQADEAVDNLHQVLANELANEFMLEHGYKCTDAGYERRTQILEL